MRIAVMGYSGSGKSDLAVQLGLRYALPTLHLDCVHFREGWVERSDDSAMLVVDPWMKQENWVIDGNYRALGLPKRLELADHVILLELSRLRCLVRALKRSKQYQGKSRPSMARGCPEKIDGEFLRWLLWKGRRQNRRLFQEVKKAYPEKCLVCKSPGALKKLLKMGL